jgi:hypothetical protein
VRSGLAVGRADFATRKLRTAAIPVMEELRRRTNESVYLAIRYKRKIALIERLDGINPVIHAWALWQAGPMHATSLGKAILAFRDPQALRQILERSDMARRGPNTITNREQLMVALAEPMLRREGVSMNELPSSSAAARRLGWTMSKFNRKLDNVCDKLDRMGVQGLRGGAGKLATNRRARLVEYAVTSHVITRADLPILDDETLRNRVDPEGD